MRSRLVVFTVLFTLSSLFNSVHTKADGQTVGLFEYNKEQSFNGLTLFAPIGSPRTYLIDNCGYLVHTWTSTRRPGLAVYLRPDGSLFRCCASGNTKYTAGGAGGVLELMDWDGNMIWSYVCNNDSICQHHDAYPMANGNYLVIEWELHGKAEILANGHRPGPYTEIWSERVIEIKPKGDHDAEIVWQWRLWDHLTQSFDSTKPNYTKDVSDHPELLDLNYGVIASNPDWMHLNSVQYDSLTDQIVLSSHNSSEIWVIDHSTTTAEAASHSGGKYGRGGDFLYRWGNPQAYKAGTDSDQRLGVQHDAQFIRRGNDNHIAFLVFNNVAGKVGTKNYSSVDIIEPEIDEQGRYLIRNKRFTPDSAAWRYVAPDTTSFSAPIISGAQILPNGNTLICDGPSGHFFEINSNKEIVWSYVNSDAQGVIVAQGGDASNNLVFRCNRFDFSHPAFANKVLTHGAPIELKPLASTCSALTSVNEERDFSGNSRIITGSTHEGCAASILRVQTDLPEHVRVDLYDLNGHHLLSLVDAELSPGIRNFTLPEAYAQQLFMVQLVSNSGVQRVPFIYQP